MSPSERLISKLHGHGRDCAALLEHLASVAPNAIVRLFTRLLHHLAGSSSARLTWGIVVTLGAAFSGMGTPIG